MRIAASMKPALKLQPQILNFYENCTRLSDRQSFSAVVDFIFSPPAKGISKALVTKRVIHRWTDAYDIDDLDGVWSARELCSADRISFTTL